VGIALTTIVLTEGPQDRRLALLAVIGVLTFGATLGWGRSGRAWLWLAVGLGAAGVATGAGVGVRWLILDGMGLISIAGLIALVGGLIVLVSAFRRLSEGRPAWAKILAVLPAALVLVIVVWALAAAIAATNVPPTALIESPSDFGMRAEEVGFLTPDGVDIAAWFVPSTEGKTVILRHGAGSTASSALPHAAVLAASGYGVLVTNARGHGPSAGDAMDFGWFGDLDITAALDYLSTRPDVDMQRVALVGLSMGGEEALGAFGADDRIAAVIAEGATARTATDKQWLADVYGVRGWLQIQIERLQYGLTTLLSRAPNPRPLAESVRSASPRPVLLIAGGDMPDEINAAEFIAREAGAHVSVWVIPGAGHTEGLSTAPESWKRTVVSFLDTAMGG
jgi:uncharacterized protein